MGDRKPLIYKNAALAIIVLLPLVWLLHTPAGFTGLPETSILVDADCGSIARDARQQRDTSRPRTDIFRPSTETSWQRQELEPGIFWMHSSDSLFGTPQYLNVLVMDADTAAARFRLEAADRVDKPHPPAEPLRRLTASEFARISDPLAVINAGFFSDHPEYVSSGIFKVEGEVYPFMKQEPDELRFVGSSAIGIDEDGNWMFRNRENDAWPDDWPETHTALAGAHRLIEKGVIPESVASESYVSTREQRHAGLRHPRTAICLTDGVTGHSGSRTTSGFKQSGTGTRWLQHGDEPPEGADNTGSSRPEIIILVADGRHDEAVGLTLRELAKVLLDLGCVDAVNLDGGGSSTMYIRDRGVVNHPSGNRRFDHEGERAVRTVIMIQ